MTDSMHPDKEAIVKPHPVLSDYYSNETERRQRVDEMFDSSAVYYDKINSIMSFGSGKWYRRQALLRAGVANGHNVLDVGAGTGVVSLLSQEIVGETGSVTALDPSAGMLTVAKANGVKNTLQGLGEHLPFPDNSFDFVTMGYALRHVTDLKLLFTEYNRVLKPGGKILLLEITQPQHWLGRAMIKFYLKWIIPTITRLFLGSAKAQRLMQYYWDTIENCVPPATILSTMQLAGLSSVNRHLAQGLFSEYTGVKA